MMLRARTQKALAATLKNMTDSELEAIVKDIDPAIAERICALPDSELHAVANGTASPELLKRIGE